MRIPEHAAHEFRCTPALPILLLRDALNEVQAARPGISTQCIGPKCAQWRVDHFDLSSFSVRTSGDVPDEIRRLFLDDERKKRPHVVVIYKKNFTAFARNEDVEHYRIPAGYCGLAGKP